MTELQHLIITRYNVPLKFADLKPEFSPIDASWLDQRKRLFARFCLPSVERQTDQQFTWMLFFHPETPRQHYDYLQERHTVVFAMSHAEIIGGVQEHLRGHRGPVVTSRLDNDDSLAPGFVEVTRSLTTRILENADVLGLPHVVHFSTGIERDVENGSFYARDYPNGPFVSLVEDHASKDAPIRTVLARPHYDMAGSFNSTIVRSRLPMWAINVHGGNVSNRIKGSLIEDEAERATMLRAFGWSTDSLASGFDAFVAKPCGELGITPAFRPPEP